MNKKEKNKIYDKNNILIDIQLICTLVTIALLVWYPFNNNVLIFLELFLSLTLISMAINNHFVYNNKRMTIYYGFIGGLLFVLTILMMLGV